ncbi:MAG: hypothetical protein ACTHJ0_14360 [Flavipsychrobacter sp.]
MKTVVFGLCLLLMQHSALSQNDHHISYNSVCHEGRLKLFPPTANSYVNIYVDWNELQPFTVYVYKDDNEIVAQWQGDTKKNYQKALFTSKMGPGNYYIRVKSPKAEMTETFTVVH